MTREIADKSRLADERLVLRCQQELPYRTDAYTEIVDRYKNRVFAKSLQLLGNQEDVKDVSQEVFLRVFDNIKRFRRASSLSTWIYAITVNACLKELDKRRRSAWWWLREDVDQLSEEDEELLAVLSGVETRSELKKAIDKTFSQLGPSSAEILRLRFIDEMDYHSISSKLGIGLSATKMRLKRAREAFMRIYRNIGESQL